MGKTPSKETIKKISESQKWVSVLSRGRPGRVIPLEVRQKIRQTRLGQQATETDWGIVHREMALRGISKYAITSRPIPDAVFIENGKLVALELEKKPMESEIRRKMKAYKDVRFMKK